jgi:hypothetical protein
MANFIKSTKMWENGRTREDSGYNEATGLCVANSRATLSDERGPRVRSISRLSAAEGKFLYEKVIKQHASAYDQRPEELFSMLASYSSELRESLLKNRIVKDSLRLGEKDDDIRAYRSTLAQLLRDPSCQPDVTIVDRLQKFPKLKDELDDIATQPKKSAGSDFDLVLHTMQRQIGSLKSKVTSLEECNAELSRSSLKKALFQPVSAKKSSPSPIRVKAESPQLVDVKRKKLIDLVRVINCTYMNSESLADLWELDFKVLQMMKADRAQLFKLDRAKGAFVTQFNGVLQQVSAKTSLMTVAYTQKQIIQVSDDDVSFDHKINSIFGGSAKHQDILPILNSSSQPVAMLVVLRRSNANILSELALVGSILSASFELHDVKVSSELHRRAMNLTLKACDMLYQHSDFGAFAADAAELTTELMDAERAQFLMVNEARGELFRRVKQTDAPDKFENFPLSSGIAGLCATKRTPIITHDMHTHRLFSAEVDDPTSQSRSCICIPLPAGDSKVQAVLQVADRRDGKDFSVRDCEMLSLFGSVLIRVAESVQ